jgi:large subunit ribosomal protein L21
MGKINNRLAHLQKDVRLRPTFYKQSSPQERLHMSDIAIIKTGGKQYKVKVGDTIKIEKILPPAGGEKKVEFTDLLNGAKVTAEVIENGKLPKVEVVKFHSKKRYERHIGHLQEFTKIKIESIK